MSQELTIVQQRLQQLDEVPGPGAAKSAGLLGVRSNERIHVTLASLGQTLSRSIPATDRSHVSHCMAKVYFYYSAMNAGKSTLLLQSSYNYRERGMHTMIFTPALDTRAGAGRVQSRIGLTAEAIAFDAQDDLMTRVQTEHALKPVSCVLVDEAQFLNKAQVHQITAVADDLDIPVLCYGLRTDFQGNLFEGSHWLLAWSDDLSEIKTICHCGRKATMVLRLDAAGNPVREGAQVEIGGNDRYVSVCRRHFKDALPHG